MTMETTAVTSDGAETPIEVMRKELRHAAFEDRKFHRSTALNEKRSALGEIKNKKCFWNSTDVITKARELKKRALSMDDYLLLQTSLIQNQENIDSFLRVDNVLVAITRDLSSKNPPIQLVAANCCCNIALADSKACTSLAKVAGPYLVAELDTLNYPLVEVCAWTIGNLSAGSKSAFESLHAQGCLKRLSSLLSDSNESIVPSIMYAVKHCLHAGTRIITDSEMSELAHAVVGHCVCPINVETLWLLALLSSSDACAQILSPTFTMITHQIFDALEAESSDAEQVSAIIRILANTVCDPNGKAADAILDSTDERLVIFFEKLLLHPHLHIREETLWLIGNLYSLEEPNIRQRIETLIHSLPSLKQGTC